MRWPEEENEENGYPGRYRRTADATVAQYLDAPWREAAVRSARKHAERLLARAKKNESPNLPKQDQLCAWLDADNLTDVVAVILQDDAHNGVSMTGAILAEAAGKLFCSRPNVKHWQLVGRIIENDPVARRVLVDLIRRRVSKRPALREDIRTVARAIVRQPEKYGKAFTLRDQDTLVEMGLHWRSKPELKEIWFGLHALGHIMPCRDDQHIFDLLFEVDTAFAAELIEEFGNPYQPALVLQYGALDPSRRFANWLRLIEAAMPAFEADGAWNGRVLLPLLLLTAQHAMRSEVGRPAGRDDLLEHRDKVLAELAEQVVAAILARSDGAPAALRWSGWLFRSAMSQLEDERVPFPDNAESRARPAWLVIRAATRSAEAGLWSNMRPPDVPPEDELCVEAVRILSSLEHDRTAPRRDLIFQVLPDEPEHFLEGENGRRMRELPSLFVIWGKRADAFGTRVLARALFDKDVVATFADLWRRTLVLREIAEHGNAFRTDGDAYQDYIRRASETIRFVIALGINLVDYVQDARQSIIFTDRHAVALTLFANLHDAIREMLAIDPVSRKDIEYLHDQLCVRRFLYEMGYAAQNTFAAPLAETDRPTVGDMICERCEVSRSFFQSLQMLRVNGASHERIARELNSVGIRLERLVDQAERLNAIEHARKIDLEGFIAGAAAGGQSSP
ncbi:hypothetical protein [Salinarimonas ramus]|uniref:Uncharacterized protein n=1 Tax=Salinarimonas ramus TaxID=690164 RepID=A0A917Q5X3_9HYPH|nr:hypothetical protein [Salinarimonas ramus]GGK27722.1 hypothetical protein GCM10011322_12840 [Salinarimonas ramus]